MPHIHRLEAGVVNKIAAGEMIERPASVVKELLENSVDALATRVEVDVRRGGSELVRVVDNGEGIHPDDLLLAVTSHATSKIKSADDLFHVRTMGFRGEALASISAVTRLRIRSRRERSETGYELEVVCGAAGLSRPCGCPVGTSIEVRQLFGNTPVRRKFLKTDATEFGHIGEQFTRLTLAHPRLHAVLRHNEKTVYELPSTERLIERLRLFYGDQLAEHLIWLESETDEVRLWGYVAHPSQSKASRKGQYLFLNGRWIQDRSLQHALSEGYRGLLMTGRHPIAFLFLEMPPDQVDVNVHPTKTEVRFRDAQSLYRQLLSTLRSKFLGMDLGSTMSLPPTPGSSEPAGPLDVERRQELQMELVDWAQEQLSGRLVDGPVDSAKSAEARSPVSDDFVPFGPAESLTAVGPGDSTGISRKLVVAETRGEETSRSPSSSWSTGAYRAMQVLDCYLVVEDEQGLTVIDQHALHERIIYEQLRHRVLEGVVESQRLLVPETIELSSREVSLLLEHRELLAQLGFGVEEFGNHTLLLTGYPAILSRADHGRLIRDVAEQIDTPGKNPTRRDILDSLMHMMACRAAVKAGNRLAPEEMESLLAQRHLIDNAHHCPHGRPTALTLSRAELDRQFGRLG